MIDNLPYDSYAYKWEWLGPGGPPGLQNRCRVALRAVVGSTPIHSRLFILSRSHGIFFDQGETILHMAIRDDQPLIDLYPEDFFIEK